MSRFFCILLSPVCVTNATLSDSKLEMFSPLHSTQSTAIDRKCRWERDREIEIAGGRARDEEYSWYCQTIIFTFCPCNDDDYYLSLGFGCCVFGKHKVNPKHMGHSDREGGRESDFELYLGVVFAHYNHFCTQNAISICLCMHCE